jgi:oxysterol-binding protein-related protein 9/10/11
VIPGDQNLGIFITLEQRSNETYQLTHPAAYLGGILRGALSVSVGDQAYITCPQTKLKAILNYHDEGWLGRSVNKVDGVIFRYDPDKEDKLRVKDVPDAEVLARLSGPWKEKIIFTLGPKPFVSRCLLLFAAIILCVKILIMDSCRINTRPRSKLLCSTSLH